MKLERLSLNNKALFDRAFQLYQAAFPEEERRDSRETERALQKEEYHFCMLTEKDSLVGIMLYWEIGELIFLEHFAILPELRNQGFGAAALELLKAKGKTVLLEIEPPEDEMTTRRYGFYKRNGFVMNEHHHIQAKYHLGDEDLILKILTYPEPISREDYLSFYDFMSREIGIVPQIAENITLRKMRPEDDARRVAGLIYYTDPYIYPYWFDSFDDAVKVLSQMIDLPTLYNRENILVAVAENGEIAGMIVSLDCPFTEKKEYVCRAFDLAGVPRDSRTEEMFEAYYAKMGTEQNIHYISNVVVHEDYRKRGIAAAMLTKVLQEHPVAFLECVQKNAGSWRLYQRLGFEIECEYPGVFDVPCFKMEYRKEAK